MGRPLLDGMRAHRPGLFANLVVSLPAGCVGLHLLLSALAAAGWPWGRRTLAVSGAAIALCGLLAKRRRAGKGPRRESPALERLSWGDGLALLSLLVFALFALELWITLPDFIYHWGLKGHRFFLAHTIDYAYLEQGWNWVIHPDYPNLLPELYATTALLAGRFEEPAMMLWSVIFFALLLAAARVALAAGEVDGFVAQATLGLLGLACAAFGIGDIEAGGADWMIALALVAAVPALARPTDLTGDLEIGVIAAFAAAAKAEGGPLAGFLILVQLCRHALAGFSTSEGLSWKTIAALTLPGAAVVVPWLVEVRSHRLFQAFNYGPFQPQRAAVIAAALRQSLAEPTWHGFSYSLALLPLLALTRRTRPLSAIVLFQLLFYLFVFFSVRIDPVPLIQTSCLRLLLHLVPPVLVGTAIVLARLSAPRSGEASA